MPKNFRYSRFFAIQILIVFFLFLVIPNCYAKRDDSKTPSQNQSFVDVGVVLDMNSSLGSMADLCMDMSISDFYSDHENYTTRLKLHTKDAKSVLDVNLAVQELLNDENVNGVLGPQGSMQDTLVAELGEKIRVPVISFTARISTLSHTQNPYFVRTTPDDVVQTEALATICRGFEWPQVVIFHEETEYGNQFLSHLVKAFQKVEIGIAYISSIPLSVEDSNLEKELENLKTKQTRVFLVHMNPSLGYRLFGLAKKAGMMSEGYAWIVSDSLSIFMNSMDSKTRDTMEGVVGIRPHVKESENLESFQERWKRNIILKNSTKPVIDPNIYCLWAYDTVTALIMAIEEVNKNVTDDSDLKISSFGPRLLRQLSITKFRGLSGEFELVDGKSKPPAYEIFNVVGSGEKIVGFWTHNRGIIRDFWSRGETRYSNSTKELKAIFWPGDSTTRPKGWDIPASGKLRVGIPWKHGFTEFVNATNNPAMNQVQNPTGFSIDIFLDALGRLPFSITHEFYLYNDTTNINWSYDDILHKIPKDYDMVVADATNWAPRAAYVDFSLPYSESGAVLVVKNKKPFDMWIFTKPLKWDLWLAILVSCVFMGIGIRVLENQVTINHPDQDLIRTARPSKMIYWSPLTVLAFPERSMVSNNWSFLVLMFWVFMAFILMQSYTANLSAILTVDQLKFAFSDNYYIGCQDGSFMKAFLKDQLHISESKLRSYASAEEYHKAMTRGSKNNGIDAIFDEIPYMKIFLNKYDSQYKMVGPTYRTGGFGFAFPIGSPLVSHFSKAILEVTQGPNMTFIEQRNFGPGYSSQDPLSSTISQGTSGLTVFDFAGLFFIVGSVTLLALFFSGTPIGRKLSDKTVNVFNHLFGFIMSRNSNSPSVGGYSIPGGGEIEFMHGSNGGDTSPPREGIVEEEEIDVGIVDAQDIGGEIIPAENNVTTVSNVIQN